MKKRINWGYIQPNRKNGECGERFPITYYVVFIVCTFILAGSLIFAFDRYADRQDEMLCSAAKMSGNEYQEKCQCFYEGGDIGCIKEERK